MTDAYEARLAAAGLADYAHVLRAAAERLAADPDALGRDTLVLAPADLEPKGLERRLLEAIPAGRLVRLAVDPPGVPADVRFACAAGEGNEVRAALRSCLARGVPLDEVEVLHTDPAYTQAFVAAFAALDRPGAGGDADAETLIGAPVTFAEGLPCTLSRPGRALAAWLSWLAEGCPQPALVAMLREGLLAIGPEEGGPGFSRLAALLRSIPIEATTIRVMRTKSTADSSGPRLWQPGF